MKEDGYIKGHYTPLWDSIVTSSLWYEDDAVVKIFLTMLVLKDADHVVRLTPFSIGKMAGDKDEKEVMRVLEILSSPDKRRSEPQEHEGRRIERHPEGWLILNGDKYQQKMRQVNRRAYQKAWAAERRARARLMERPINVGDAREQAAVAAVESGDQGLAEKLAEPKS